MISMLKVNNLDFTAEAADIVYAIRGIASKSISEETFNTWVQTYACAEYSQTPTTALKPKS